MIDYKYSIQTKLGSGGSSEVFLVSDDNDNNLALKMIKKYKRTLDCSRMSVIQKEYYIMNILSLHPNILKCIDCIIEGEMEFNSNKFIVTYNVMEFANNGSLSIYLRKTGCFDESIAKFYICQLASAVKFMHDCRIAHLDIKPLNILLDENFNLKLADFGSAEYDPTGTNKVTLRRGTQGFMAPEVAELTLRTEYDAYKADVYSLGVTIYMILCGRLPETESECDQSTKTVDFDSLRENSEFGLCVQNQHFCSSEQDIMYLVDRMLSTNPSDRPSMKEVLDHPLLQSTAYDITPDEVYLEMSKRKEQVLRKPIQFNF